MSLPTEVSPPPPRPPSARPRARTVAALVRHQLGAATTSLADFTTMIGVVRLGHLPATVGTAAGATVGAIVNFTLSRRWVFAGPQGGVPGQAVRYGAVALGSLLLNVALVWLLHDRGGLHYVVSRLLGSVLVSLLWNFPMQRHFVFVATP